MAVADRGERPDRSLAPSASDGMWRVMTKCWSAKPGERFAAANLLEEVRGIIGKRETFDDSKCAKNPILGSILTRGGPEGSLPRKRRIKLGEIAKPHGGAPDVRSETINLNG